MASKHNNATTQQQKESEDSSSEIISSSDSEETFSESSKEPPKPYVTPGKAELPPVSHSCSQDPPLDVSPLRAIFDPEAKIPDEQMPEPHLMGISTESSDSSDVEILRSPIIKNKDDAAGDNISTHAPKIIPRVEITEDADADPRFQQPSEKTKATEANPIQTSKEDPATNPTKEDDADLVGNKAGKDGPTMEEEKASDDQNTFAKILKESRQEVPPNQNTPM